MGMDTDTERGLLLPSPLLLLRLSLRLTLKLTMGMEDTAVAMEAMVDMALAVMEDMEAMEVMAAMVDTDTARGLLMLMPTMAMVDTVGMAAMVDMDTERGQLMPMPTMAMVDM